MIGWWERHLTRRWRRERAKAEEASRTAARLAKPLEEAAAGILEREGAWHLPGKLPYVSLLSVDRDGRLRFLVERVRIRTFSIEQLARGAASRRPGAPQNGMSSLSCPVGPKSPP